MSDLNLTVETKKSSMDDIRPLLDTAIKSEFPGGMMKSRWEDDVLHLSGPGAQGTITLQGSQLVGHASLRPPASMMKPMIEQKMSQVLKSAAS